MMYLVKSQKNEKDINNNIITSSIFFFVWTISIEIQNKYRV